MDQHEAGRHDGGELNATVKLFDCHAPAVMLLLLLLLLLQCCCVVEVVAAVALGLVLVDVNRHGGAFRHIFPAAM